MLSLVKAGTANVVKVADKTSGKISYCKRNGKAGQRKSKVQETKPKKHTISCSRLNIGFGAVGFKSCTLSPCCLNLFFRTSYLPPNAYLCRSKIKNDEF